MAGAEDSAPTVLELEAQMFLQAEESTVQGCDPVIHREHTSSHHQQQLVHDR